MRCRILVPPGGGAGRTRWGRRCGRQGLRRDLHHGASPPRVKTAYRQIAPAGGSAISAAGRAASVPRKLVWLHPATPRRGEQPPRRARRARPPHRRDAGLTDEEDAAASEAPRSEDDRSPTGPWHWLACEPTAGPTTPGAAQHEARWSGGLVSPPTSPRFWFSRGSRHLHAERSSQGCRRCSCQRAAEQGSETGVRHCLAVTNARVSPSWSAGRPAAPPLKMYSIRTGIPVPASRFRWRPRPTSYPRRRNRLERREVGRLWIAAERRAGRLAAASWLVTATRVGPPE
jgi:hypothetical protein